MLKVIGKLPAHCFSSSAGSSLPNVFIAVNKLRHSAVHRLPTTVKGIVALIQSAIDFSRALQDDNREQRLKDLLAEVEIKMKALELNKNYLETRLEEELSEIARLRKELDTREKDAAINVRKEDREYVSLVGNLLSQSITAIFDPAEVDDGVKLDKEEESEAEFEPMAEQANGQTDEGGLQGDPHLPNGNTGLAGADSDADFLAQTSEVPDQIVVKETKPTVDEGVSLESRDTETNSPTRENAPDTQTEPGLQMNGHGPAHLNAPGNPLLGEDQVERSGSSVSEGSSEPDLTLKPTDGEGHFPRPTALPLTATNDEVNFQEPIAFPLPSGIQSMSSACGSSLSCSHR